MPEYASGMYNHVIFVDTVQTVQTMQTTISINQMDYVLLATSPAN